MCYAFDTVITNDASVGHVKIEFILSYPYKLKRLVLTIRACASPDQYDLNFPRKD